MKFIKPQIVLRKINIHFNLGETEMASIEIEVPENKVNEVVSAIKEIASKFSPDELKLFVDKVANNQNNKEFALTALKSL